MCLGRQLFCGQHRDSACFLHQDQLKFLRLLREFGVCCGVQCKVRFRLWSRIGSWDIFAAPEESGFF
jgi:hypothetical protein